MEVIIMITRGTTPYHTFIVPLAPEQIDEVYVTYLQNGEIILDKSSSDLTITEVELETENAHMEDYEENPSEETSNKNSQITLHLTQEDTLKFHFLPAAEKNIAVVQLRILDTQGEAFASEPVQERIYGVLKEGVITSNETNTNN